MTRERFLLLSSWKQTVHKVHVCYIVYLTVSLVPRPSHVFQCIREKSGMLGQFGDIYHDYGFATISTNLGRNGGRYVIITSPNLPSLPILLTCVEKHGYEALISLLSSCHNSGLQKRSHSISVAHIQNDSFHNHKWYAEIAAYVCNESVYWIVMYNIALLFCSKYIQIYMAWFGGSLSSQMPFIMLMILVVS